MEGFTCFPRVFSIGEPCYPLKHLLLLTLVTSVEHESCSSQRGPVRRHRLSPREGVLVTWARVDEETGRDFCVLNEDTINISNGLDVEG